ncbi:TetR/AcrR family transcriptional regulator [Pseudovibrio sp. Tun.PSC04-5.I4]|uniref:TetR/AcrR family transcriptional regulator n=1 Tax=Pseudovibrio sp. Tun.PSC04-5.I4 TaxID=1798213 RepID=UPI00088EAC92|nr:TetR/AcrR family transcriptional regulator [Pseudovibrio sp. Tun.PSC04-5.I4]SDR10657.1 transcriptional regulator, TetR family [Pseudovibrio sp. Tun.PSC04-5.I4]
MARPQSYDKDTLAAKALVAFWKSGYHATSMDDLVHETGVSRHGLYKEFGDKKGALLKSFDLYQSAIVSPAFERVEREAATMNEIVVYFEHQISLAEKDGLPGRGCFVANSATEIAPHDTDVRQKIDEHFDRLRHGFASALKNSLPANSDKKTDHIAETMVVFATGLWSLSRVISDGTQLRVTVETFLNLVKKELT